MDVILLERIEKLGQMGDQVVVKDGFARNFLLPKGKALRATDANRAVFEEQRAQLEARNLEQKKEAEAVGEKLNGESFVVIRQSSESGQLYGSVNVRDIAAAATDGGFSIDRSQVNIAKPIKTIGLHEIAVVLHPEVIVNITINVARTEDEAERQAAGEQVLGEKDEDREGLLTAEDLFDPEALDGDDEDETGEDAGEETAEAQDEEEKTED